MWVRWVIRGQNWVLSRFVLYQWGCHLSLGYWAAETWLFQTETCCKYKACFQECEISQEFLKNLDYMLKPCYFGYVRLNCIYYQHSFHLFPFTFWNEATRGLFWWSSSQDSELSLHGMLVRYQVGELRCHMPLTVAIRLPPPPPRKAKTSKPVMGLLKNCFITHVAAHACGSVVSLFSR